MPNGPVQEGDVVVVDTKDVLDDDDDDGDDDVTRVEYIGVKADDTGK